MNYFSLFYDSQKQRLYLKMDDMTAPQKWGQSILITTEWLAAL